MTDSAQKTAVVIGASGGMGRAIALRLARDGFAVLAHYSGNAAGVSTSIRHRMALRSSMASPTACARSSCGGSGSRTR